jgi:hypothetical protein
VAVDLFDNAYISGTTSGSLAGPYQGFQDAFLTKFDGSGNLLWSRQIGASDEDRSTSVAVDASGNPYISGFTRNSLGGPNAGGFDAFLMKFDAAGNTLWSRQIGTTGSGAADDSSSIALDSLGNAYISGDTSGSLAAPSAGGGGDAILIKYDSAGNLLWSRQIGTTNYDQSSAVAVDAAGNAYISGISGGSLGGPNAGFYDAFLFKYDGAGNVLWSRQIGTSDYDYSGSIAVDGAGNAFISGQTYGSLGGPSAGDADAFLIKFAVPEPANLMLIGLCLQFLMWRNLRPLFSSKSCGKSSID